MNTSLASSYAGVDALLFSLIAASVLGAVIYCIRQGQGRVAYFLGGLTGLPALALIPGINWGGDVKAIPGTLLLFSLWLIGLTYWGFILKHGFQRGARMTLVLCLLAVVVCAATIGIRLSAPLPTSRSAAPLSDQNVSREAT